jgi:hypothetical protein
MEIKIVDGFVWCVVTKRAKEVWDSNLFELYILHNDGSESSVHDYGIDVAIEMAREYGLEIGIEGGYLTPSFLQEANSFEINTTAYNEENFIIATELSEEQVVGVLAPFVERKRDLDEDYTNADLVDELEYVYPNHLIIELSPSKITI